MVKTDNLSFTYGKRFILENFNMIINDGECVCICGESGKGKSTLAKLLAGLLKQTSGSIDVPKNVSFVFQEDRLLNNMNVIKNVCLNVDKSRIPFAESLLARLGLFEWKNAKISDLSGGMRRRVAIARAVCHGGDLLILDEPFNGIDLENKRIIADIVKEEYLLKGKCVLLISHIANESELLGARRINI